jgi:hypothetical protein
MLVINPEKVVIVWLLLCMCSGGYGLPPRRFCQIVDSVEGIEGDDLAVLMTLPSSAFLVR